MIATELRASHSARHAGAAGPGPARPIARRLPERRSDVTPRPVPSPAKPPEGGQPGSGGPTPLPGDDARIRRLWRMVVL
ncbi:hypothetical protein [Alsobacter sp. R-9]